MLKLFDFPSWFVGFCVLVILYWFLTKKTHKLPPGPRGLPLVGYLPYLGNSAHEKIRRLSEEYGPVVCLNILGEKFIFLNDFTSVKETFNNSAALNRPGNFFNTLVPGGLGLASLNGEEWVEQRRYCRKTLKNIGVGTIPWEGTLEGEIEDFISFLRNQEGRAVDIEDPLMTAMSNNIVSVILGKRLLQGDPRRALVHESTKSFVRVLTPNNKGSLCPRLFKFLSKLGLTPYVEDFKVLDTFHQFLWKEVESRKAVPVMERNEDIFIDGYLSEMEKCKEKRIPSFFCEKNLVTNSQALVFAATETSTTSFLWLLRAVCQHQDVQRTIQSELDTVLGRDGQPKWTERAKLPYTYATILEQQRWRTVAPFGLYHRTSDDIKIGEYDVPKNTTIAANLYSLHNDPKYWKNPESFEPERFLNSDGSLVSHKLESYVPFSIGRRSCPGEMIALMEIFHFLISILQRFHVRTADGDVVLLEGKLEGTYQPLPQKLRFIQRE